MYVCINIKREVQSHAYTFIDLTKADYDMISSLHMSQRK